MCGIFCSLSRHYYIVPDATTKQLLQNRGPDSIGQHQALIAASLHDEDATARPLHATFVSTVLSLRGATVIEQPLRDDETGSVLCWNGEAWSIHGEAVEGNDSVAVFDKLLAASICASSTEKATKAVIACLASIRGPYAFVFYDAINTLLYYGRDCLGRRSLVQKATSDDVLVLSSVCDNGSGDAWSEVEADDVYILDLSTASMTQSFRLPRHVTRRTLDGRKENELSIVLPFPPLNRNLTDDRATTAKSVDRLDAALQISLQLRTQHIREAVPSNNPRAGSSDVRVAVLFSGGLDCTILARLCHDLLPIYEPIDLLNVAFENPRVHAKLAPGTSPYELCPDRVTGRSSYAELSNVCPGRCWQFVEINVPYADTVAHRATVMSLMHPHNTEMDLSISYALYFASRWTGVAGANSEAPATPYSTTARVLLSGLGADELFGGYQRHATAFARHGYAGLFDEMELDFTRLGKRNLGRDDRVISDSGKEVRFPYLDEDFIAVALDLPVTAKCDFGIPQDEASEDPALFLEPGKRILRQLAWQLGMKRAAAEKKRAIQFGARTAKMETGKTKGTHVLN